MWLALALALISGLPVSAHADRIAANETAQEEFRQLNFFADGNGMHISPGLAPFADPGPNSLENLFGMDSTVMRLRWGVNWNSEELRPEGFFNVPYGKMNVGVLGCVACHSGRAAGHYYIGLGNKNIDPFQIGQDAEKVEETWKTMVPFWQKSADYRQVEDSAIAFAKRLSVPYANQTEGLVPTAIIRRWFYDIENVPIPQDFPRAAVKVPSFWGYGEKRKVGQFCDGFGNGNLPGWAIAVELVGGQKPEVVRSYLAKIQHAEDILADLLPPKYPFAIDMTRAKQGQALFEQTCAHCHGTYQVDAQGLPVYEAPKFVDWTTVKTDRDRLEGTTPAFIDLVGKSPLSDLIQVTPRITAGQEGYFAPRLVGIWARFPYLHNGSVPSVRALLTAPDQRPMIFSLHDAGEANRFDPENLGLTVPKPGSLEEDGLYVRAQAGERDIYATWKDGQSHQGHDFFTNLSDDQKSDLIEYLKTL